MASSPPRHTPAPFAPPPRILVLDDDPDIRRMMAGALRRRGFDVAHVADGVQGVEYLDAASRLPSLGLPHVVVADVRMPGLGGLDLLRVMRAAQLPIPVVLTTAQPDTLFAERARRLGAAGILEKPFTLEALMEIVELQLPGTPVRTARGVADRVATLAAPPDPR